MRGSGESDGLLHDEYLQQELDNAVEAIAWIARQSWCTGRVGIIGKSWGGFNSLQVAALRPPALAAIVTVCSTDDRYADDVHYMGGCLNVANPNWAFSMLARLGRPPDPAIVGARWRQMWRARLDNVRPWITDWLAHQRRDDYWRHGSVCEDYAVITCPVYAIGGWADSYSNAIGRLMQELQVPRKALIGPWGHQNPHQGFPGPAVGFLQDALRWWDHWLKDIDTGIMAEPAYRAWMQDYIEPRAFIAHRPDRWVAEPAWPSPQLRETAYALNVGAIAKEPSPPSDVMLRSPQTTGMGCMNWINGGAVNSLDEPIDQRSDDAKSLVFDGAPLAEPVEILGAPIVDIELSSDRPNAFICARLCEVRPDGISARVTYGLLNLTHRGSHARPPPPTPGERYRVCVQLNDIAHRFASGNRIRLALSSSYWPIIWPSPQVATLTICCGTGRLILPERPLRAEDAELAELPPPESTPLDPSTALREPQPPRIEIRRDYGAGTVVIVKTVDAGRMRNDTTGWEAGSRLERTLSIADGDPLSARSRTAPPWNSDAQTDSKSR